MRCRPGPNWYSHQLRDKIKVLATKTIDDFKHLHVDQKNVFKQKLSRCLRLNRCQWCEKHYQQTASGRRHDAGQHAGFLVFLFEEDTEVEHNVGECS